MKPVTTQVNIFFRVFLFLLLSFSQAVPMEPPDKSGLSEYIKDGTYQARTDFVKSIGNYRLSPRLAAKVSGIKNHRQGAPGRTLAPPPAWAGLPTSGTVKVLTLLVAFSDYPAKSSAPYVSSAIYGDGNQSNFPLESLKNYYLRSSYNKLLITGEALGWFIPSYTRSSMQQTSSARDALIKEMLNYYDSRGYDFSQYDNDNDGLIDYIIVIWTGPDTGWGNFWWGYKTNFYDPGYSVDGKKPGAYSWQWETGANDNAYKPSVVIHETGHALGLPDYYDYDDRTGPDGGVGGIDMMGGGPGDHCGFSKYLLDWLSPKVFSPGNNSVIIDGLSLSSETVKIIPAGNTDGLFSEYFMVENRQKTGNDQNLPSAGLLIWHVDARLNADGLDFLYDNSYTWHKLIRLMEADGKEEIESSLPAESGDYYTAGKNFNASSAPNSNRYDTTLSLINIGNISAAGSKMSFNLSMNTPPGSITSLACLKADSQPNVTLTWKAPGEDGYLGQANYYEIRYSTKTFTFEGFENSGLTSWQTGSGSYWNTTNTLAYQGERSVKCSGLPDNSAAWLKKNITGPVSVNFLWRTSSESTDYLYLLLDSLYLAKIGGEKNWQQRTCFIPDGSHTLEFAYQKDGYVTNGADAAWIDNVSFGEGFLDWENSVIWKTRRPAAGPAGFGETETITGLSPAVTYYFALKAADASLNWSFPSKTISTFIAPAAIMPLKSSSGFWKFEEGGGTASFDSSGSGSTVSLTGASWTQGKIGKCISFDGINDYAMISNSGGLSSQNMTVSVWIYPVSYSEKYARVLEKGGVSSGAGYGLEFNRQGNNRIGFVVWANDMSTGVESIDKIPLNSWTQVTCVYEGSMLKIFINGMLAGGAQGLMTLNSSDLTLGKASGINGNFFNGKIDELEIYGRALSENEVKALFENELLTPATYYIRGRVKGGDGSGLAGVTVSLSGTTSGFFLTAGDGYFEFNGLTAYGNYTLTASKSPFVFLPAGINSKYLESNLESLDFTASVIALATSLPDKILDFGSVVRGNIKSLDFTISDNNSTAQLSGALSADQSWITVNPATFSGNSTIITVKVLTFAMNPGDTAGKLSIKSNAGNEEITVRVTPTCVIPAPNPFVPGGAARLFFRGTGVPYATVRLYSLAGDFVRELKETEGKNEIQWNGSLDTGSLIGPGIYFYTASNPLEPAGNKGYFTVKSKR